MGTPRIVVNPTCNTGYFDKANTICVSLYTAEVRSADGKSIVKAAKSFHQCWQGNAQVPGEALAGVIVRAATAAGFGAAVVPPAGYDPNAKNELGVPLNAPSKEGNAKTATIEFTDIDLLDYYFTEVNYGGSWESGGAGRVNPDGNGWGNPAKAGPGASDPPAVPPSWGPPGRTPPKPPTSSGDKPVPGPVPTGRPDEKKSIVVPSCGILVPFESTDTLNRAGVANSVAEDRKWAVLGVRPANVRAEGSLRLEILGPRSRVHEYWSTMINLSALTSPNSIATELASQLSSIGMRAMVFGDFLAFSRPDGRTPPFFWVSYLPPLGKLDGLYVMLGDLPLATLAALKPRLDSQNTTLGEFRGFAPNGGRPEAPVAAPVSARTIGSPATVSGSVEPADSALAAHLAQQHRLPTNAIEQTRFVRPVGAIDPGARGRSDGATGGPNA